MWRKFEPVIRNRLPSFVISILKNTGYDNIAALQRINSEEITIIEKYAQDNLIELIKKDKQYSHQAENFKFLPGHKAALIALPEIVKDYVENYESKLKSKSKKSKCDSNQLVETLEINFTKEDENLLKASLLKKVENYAQTVLKSDLQLPEENISHLDVAFNKAGDIIKKCVVKCIKCDIKTSCSFNKVWQISNFEKHLKGCYLGKNFGKTSEQTPRTTVELPGETVQKSPGIAAEKSPKKVLNLESNIVKPNQENEDDLMNLIAETSVESGDNVTLIQHNVQLDESVDESLMTASMTALNIKKK